ncbi:MAG: NAD-dependent epimerase/dehydratase family protein [Caenispirillum sp.]|nr:NAD-dependent epimerase/dehydratase family protein [Caenispirillum sp.]
MKRAFVTGGSGFLGGRLIEMLVERNIEVLALARSPVAARKVEQRGARAVMGDLSRPAELAQGLEGVDVVFHAAAFLHFWGNWQDFVAAHVDGTLGMIEAAERGGAKRVVLISAASVVMGNLEALIDVDETAPLTELRVLPYSATKALAERAGLARPNSKITVTAVRPPLIWGPGDTFDRELGERIRSGRFAYFNGGRYPYSVCHVDNACHGAILAAEHGRAGEAYFLADTEVTEARDFLDDRILAAGLTPPKMSVPSRVAWVMAGALEGVWRMFRLGGEPPLTREVVRLMGAPFTISLKKAEQELGYRAVVTRREALQAMKRR